MPVTVVVGGQFGSEGKGKVAHFFAKNNNASVAIRCGGPNSGHTVIGSKGKPIIFQQLPTPSILPNINIVLCAGCYINLAILEKEIQIAKLAHDRLYIDPNAVIISEELINFERKYGLIDSIGSTGSGTGEAILARIKRNGLLTFAKQIPKLKQYVKDTKSFLRNSLAKNERIILEGTQGFGLSILHSPFYPFVTSRDTIAASFLSEAGMSPFDVDEIILTIRAFPIRVSGNSGPLENEIEWRTVTKESGSDYDIFELTSVSKKLRRVARFDPAIVNQAICANNPNKIVLNHLDHIDFSGKYVKKPSDKILNFIIEVENSIKSSIDFLGFGPDKLVHRSFVFG
jgi:adenylosuccinate synthase